MTEPRRFPTDFLWGAATSSYQIEGAVEADGRGPSIWDTFSRIPGAVVNGENGDVAIDHYHRVADDVKLMGDLGLNAYRFSVAWPRVQPTGSGPANQAGLDFYRRLTDQLLDAGIAPALTLYHWDLPQPLQDAGGWPNRDTAYRFAEYAGLVADALGDRVNLWITLNESWCAAYLGYLSGEHAPGIKDPAQALASVHTLNLAHGLGAAAIHEHAGPDAKVAIAHNIQVNQAATAAPQDVAVKTKLDLVNNEILLAPQLDGAYPEGLFEATAAFTDWSFVQDGDLEIIHAPLDALGLNYYSTSTVRAGEDPDRDPFQPTLVDGVARVRPEGEYTEMGWLVEPQGLTDLLLDMHRRRPGLPLYITENGAAFDDVVADDGRVHDERRTAYLHAHLEAVGRALDAGANVRGYFAWSLTDNFEWSYGYGKRFGLVHVDYATQTRTIKDSGHWYSGVTTTGLLPAPVDPLG
ncbi:GH1 family beta-glucosidase [Kineosporia sp. NBRC 101731]|uniref:GH1 family beta-glucosidase n=1 Tax=Kineosporia sp. NBRC 101731 TaxID=3032199 RepID=UPI0024A40028|nr:GH1 family beta-glucosidase [Kineosporia sp. NBRC 101731]GLY30911.1 beta-glucosidase [Kineosporia sp. NBRC 101731]